jgi:aubergine-like protein
MMREHGDNWQDNLKKEITGTTVLTDYTNKTYTVDGIDFSKTPRSTFQVGNGEMTSYAEYYLNKYGLKIDDKDQFLLISRARERDILAGHPEFIYLIPELSRATGMTDQMRSNFKLMKEISDYTRLNPEKRVNALIKFNRRIQDTPESARVFHDWCVELDRDLVDVDIHELPPETIIFGGEHQECANAKNEWVIKGRTTMYKAVDCTRWIFLYPSKIERESKHFLKTLIEAAADMNYTISEPMMKGIEDDRQETYGRVIQSIADRKPNFVLIVLPTNRADRYSSLKNLCVVKYGIPSQMVVENRVLRHKNLRSICTKIAIQMNCKLGGIPWLVKVPVSGLMTVGFDVSHDPKDRRKSLGAMVATMDVKKSSCFYSVTMEYKDGNDMVQQVDQHLKRAIEIYKETIGAYPERIVYYRDGVGDSQVQFVKKQEVEPIVATLRDIYGDKQEPRFAFIIVNKRTNARFFKKSGSQWVNPKPGSIINSGVTMRGRQEFYLISTSVNTGTTNPTHYNIIYNTTGLDQEKIEKLTYKLTLTYYNWSGGVRIPSVCQNAKKLAFLGTQSLNSTQVHENLVKSLYFL